MDYIVHSDNSEFFRKLMKTFLSELGYEVQNYARGEDAMEAINDGGASCLITGMELADMSGEELIKRLTVSSHKIPIIAVTSNEAVVQSKRLDALGVKATILKSGDWKTELSKILA
ncbi:MAG: response regulator [Treponema sp.]|jgi:FixJ family two-component response regulator|nr:response regulator [Treponema sp.]